MARARVILPFLGVVVLVGLCSLVPCVHALKSMEMPGPGALVSGLNEEDKAKAEEFFKGQIKKIKCNSCLCLVRMAKDEFATQFGPLDELKDRTYMEHYKDVFDEICSKWQSPPLSYICSSGLGEYALSFRDGLILDLPAGKICMGIGACLPGDKEARTKAKGGAKASIQLGNAPEGFSGSMELDFGAKKDLQEAYGMSDALKGVLPAAIEDSKCTACRCTLGHMWTIVDTMVQEKGVGVDLSTDEAFSAILQDVCAGNPGLPFNAFCESVFRDGPTRLRFHAGMVTGETGPVGMLRTCLRMGYCDEKKDPGEKSMLEDINLAIAGKPPKGPQANIPGSNLNVQASAGGVNANINLIQLAEEPRAAPETSGFVDLYPSATDPSPSDQNQAPAQAEPEPEVRPLWPMGKAPDFDPNDREDPNNPNNPENPLGLTNPSSPNYDKNYDPENFDDLRNPINPDSPNSPSYDGEKTRQKKILNSKFDKDPFFADNKNKKKKDDSAPCDADCGGDRDWQGSFKSTFSGSFGGDKGAVASLKGSISGLHSGEESFSETDSTGQVDGKDVVFSKEQNEEKRRKDERAADRKQEMRVDDENTM